MFLVYLKICWVSLSFSPNFPHPPIVNTCLSVVQLGKPNKGLQLHPSPEFAHFAYFQDEIRKERKEDDYFTLHTWNLRLLDPQLCDHRNPNSYEGVSPSDKVGATVIEAKIVKESET